MFLGCLGLTLLLSYCLHTAFFERYYVDHYEKRLLDIFDEIEENIDSSTLTDVISEIDYRQQVDISIIDRNLHTGLRSHNQNNMTEYRLEPEFHSLITEEKERIKTSYLCITTSGLSSAPRLLFIKQLSDGRYCMLSHPWESLESSMDAMTDFHFIMGGLACFVGALCTLFLSGQFTKPIIEISKVTENLSNLDFKQKITYKSRDELGELAQSINVLSRKLEEHQVALKNEIELQKVLSQNMSHELKTPISVMKGYLEGVTHGIVDTEEGRNEYLAIVLEECDRMTCLIDRMLHLSKLTSFQEQGLSMEEISSVILAKNLQGHCGTLLKKENLDLILEVSTVEIWGNQELLVQALGNFVSNGVKYGDSKTLKLKIEEEGGYTLLSVFNSGKVVPENEVERIFNVFYVLDKARSRQMNSHGLGLAVCKTVAELHHGTAFCGSEEGGMWFSLKIPKKMI